MPIGLAHPSHVELVSFIDGELTPERRAEVATHLASCPPCSSTRSDMEAASLHVTEGLRSSAESGRGIEQRARLRSALRREATDVAPLSPGALAATVANSRWLPVAAVLLLAVGLWQIGASLLSNRQPLSARHAGRIVTLASALPLTVETPGAVSAHSAQELCAGSRPSRLVTDETRRQVLRRYGMEHVPQEQYELDALITPELGGTTEAANLWPQRYNSPVWNARVKDDLERLLPDMVCRGELDLATAQSAIAADWIAAYKKFFRTDVPLVARGGPVVDDDDLILLPASWPTPVKTAER